MDIEEKLIRKHLSTITDGLGMPIDPGILELVVALNLNNIPTVQSCQGHTDRKNKRAYPWVSIGSDSPVVCLHAQARLAELLAEYLTQYPDAPALLIMNTSYPAPQLVSALLLNLHMAWLHENPEYNKLEVTTNTLQAHLRALNQFADWLLLKYRTKN